MSMLFCCVTLIQLVLILPAEIGELPLGVSKFSSILPKLVLVCKELSVYGDDYPTADGTAVRDYIHVVDLRKAHVVALQTIAEQKKNIDKVETFNLGQNRKYSTRSDQGIRKVSGQNCHIK
jgi:UDP-glucose 4-epimerase